MQVGTLTETLEKQKALIRKLQGLLFGKRSEQAPRPTPARPSSAETEAPGEPAAATPVSTSTAGAAPRAPRGQRRGAPGHGRRLYEELETREVIHDVPEAARCCPQCGIAYVACGTEEASEIEWEVQIRRVLHKRKKYRRNCACHAPVLVTAPAPPKLIPKGLLAVPTISQLVINKYLYGQPLHRQIAMLETHSGIRLAPGTLSGVLEQVGVLLRPLYTTLREHLRTAHHWHADETRWMQYVEGAQTRWWLWLFASADTVVFVLDPTRSRAVPRRLFGLDDPEADRSPSTGILNCDRWKSYQGLPGILAAYCWSHVRRDFLNLGKAFPCRLGAWTAAWVARIGGLYHLTRQRRLTDPGTEAFRDADAHLRLQVDLMAQQRDDELASSTLVPQQRTVLESLVHHWEGLMLFLEHLEVPLDNNEAERFLRTPVVGRKNFYGSGSLGSGQLAEGAYSVLFSAQRLGLNALSYLSAYLEACAQHQGQAPTDLTRFCPWQIRAEDRARWTRPPPKT